ncbi:NADP-dependent oxidoreductase domain-containing protein [Aspergillus spinulosporus]
MPVLVGREVGPVGLGLMGLTWCSAPPPQEQAFATMCACYCWNGAAFCGTPDHNSLVLIKRYFEKYLEDADKIVLSIKGGGRKKINMFEFGRRDPNVLLKVTFGIIDKEYVHVESFHEAVKYTKIVAVEAKLSMFTPDILDNGIAASCAQYGIPMVAFSPMAVFNFPRFQQENLEKNLQLVSKVEEIAARKGCAPAQLAINWTIALSRRLNTTIAPNSGFEIVGVTDEELAQIDAIAKSLAPAGEC